MITENWDQLAQDLKRVFQQLGDVAAENFRHFCTKGKSINTDYRVTFENILNVLEPLQLSVESILNSCSKYDSKSCVGNGYRSMVFVVWKCACKLLEVSREVQCNRERLFFRSFHFYMELDSYAQVLSRLFTMVQFCILLMDMSKPGCLFPNCSTNEHDVLELLQDFESINRESFYGRTLGFQFASSLKQSLQVIGVAIAAYGDGFDKHENPGYRALYSVLHSGKYVVDPELRARRIVDLTHNINIDFCKELWSLTERHGIQHFHILVSPNLAVSKEFTVLAEPMDISRLNGEKLIVSLSSKNHMHKSIDGHLLSYFWREGQVRESSAQDSYQNAGKTPRQKSKNLIFHCHGGGFVAQSSKSHEVYLRHWAKELRAPILSINYSLSPDSVFPEALNECFYMYVWALQNADKLGTTAENICFAGDSAGANLVVSVCLKAIEENIRLPNGIVIAYPPLHVQFVPSPSRILSLMDPLLSIGVLRGCLEAYSGLVKSPQKHKFWSPGKRKKLSDAFLGENYNAYELDLGSSLAPPWMPMFKSYSDSNLMRAEIESKRSMKHNLFNSPSFQGNVYACEGIMNDNREVLIQDKNILEYSDSISIDSSSSGIQMHSTKRHMQVYKCWEGPNDNKTVDGDFEGRLITVDSKGPGITFFDSNNTTFTKDVNFKISCENQPLPTNNGVENRERLGRRPRAGTFHGLRQRSLSEDGLRVGKRTFSYPRYDADQVQDDESGLRNGQLLSWSKSKAGANETRTNADHDSYDGSSSSRETDDKIPKDYSVMYNKRNSACHIVNSRSILKDRALSVNEDEKTLEGDEEIETSLTEEQGDVTFETLLHAPLDHLMSPMSAPVDVLKKLPKISILASALDPMFDDSVEFTKLLEELGKEIDLYVMENLPHGFLQFSGVCNEAKEASDLMAACMKQTLQMVMHRVQSDVPGSYGESEA